MYVPIDSLDLEDRIRKIALFLVQIFAPKNTHRMIQTLSIDVLAPSRPNSITTPVIGSREGAERNLTEHNTVDAITN